MNRQKGNRPHVDIRRRDPNNRPDRLLDPPACDSVLGRNPSLSTQVNRGRDRRVGLSAIGQCFKDQYGALTTHCPASSPRTVWPPGIPGTLSDLPNWTMTSLG